MFSDPKLFLTQMNFYENDLWCYKTEILNLRLSKLPSAKVLLKPEFDTKDQVLFSFFSHFKNNECGTAQQISKHLVG